MKNRKISVSPLALLLVATLVVGIGAAVVTHFRLQRPANYEITENTYGITMYLDEACTVVATSLEFGTYVSGSLEQTPLLTGTYYFKPDTDPGLEEVAVTVDLPSGMPAPLVEGDLVLEVLIDEAGVPTWTTVLHSNEVPDFGWNWPTVDFPLDLSGGPTTRAIRLTLDVTTQTLGIYTFNVNFDVGTNGV